MDILSGIWGAKGVILEVVALVGIGGTAAVAVAPPAVVKKIGLLLGTLMKVFLGQKIGKARYYASTAEDFIESMRDGMK